jgi:hypothetical protein
MSNKVVNIVTAVLKGYGNAKPGKFKFIFFYKFLGKLE